ncbi:aromatic ring-hydroxylating dioxygenase subunit alpha [Novosphingobium sp. SL115]|uniref:aromatic ring-hydroxylating dioxygenase subunit alpha n=1 Tax=Novosphingobium sp. SL115 TaxID=2995150 RepID=UPI002272A799|nr:aromatic ring-hydroxylating dioxygenase subunit alpha [Novosphingobium sp. SL115]MCY1672695.1 aromatic ring-hydroxylating dioxygenase subunit alpha [Novosphingobium sp. SL115]
MHPLKTRQPYPRNQWWAAAYASEVGRQLLGRTILGDRIILYRTESGEAVALSGLCPHRAFPLEKGCLAGDRVRCGYHGFTFSSTGALEEVPSQTAIPAKADLRRFPVAERGGVVWIWTGAETLADETLLPDMAALGPANPDWATEQHIPATIAARYTLLIDNLLDLSHASFIHADTIPGGDYVASLPVELVETPASLNVRRIGRGLPSNPFFKLMFPHHEGPLDQAFDAEYFGPHLIRTGGALFDSAGGARLGTQNYLHIITPETPGSLHYFVVTSRDFATGNPALGRTHVDMGLRIQPQDKAAIEAIEQVLQGLSHPPREVSARCDTGALKVRHRLESQIRAEEQAA